MNQIAATLAILAALLMAASSTLFVVDQRQVGVIYALGEIK
ncbi:MAG: protease modulator HflC, partial [Rubrivivax sp.]